LLRLTARSRPRYDLQAREGNLLSRVLTGSEAVGRGIEALERRVDLRQLVRNAGCVGDIELCVDRICPEIGRMKRKKRQVSGAVLF
jgi:hypothetical protein